VTFCLAPLVCLVRRQSARLFHKSVTPNMATITVTSATPIIAPLMSKGYAGLLPPHTVKACGAGVSIGSIGCLPW
jgi:hypothetical protein